MFDISHTDLYQKGDIIVAIDDAAVQDMDDLIVYLADRSVGQRVTLTVLCDGRR